MQNLVALRAAVFALFTKNLKVGADNRPRRARVKVLGQPVTSEDRSMTENGQNAMSSIISHLSKLEPRFKDNNVPCGV